MHTIPKVFQFVLFWNKLSLSSTQPRIFALSVRNQDRVVFKQHWDLWDSRLVSCWIQQETHVRPFLSCRTLEMCHFVPLQWHSLWSLTGTEIFHRFYLLLIQPVSSTCFVFFSSHSCLSLSFPESPYWVKQKTSPSTLRISSGSQSLNSPSKWP